MPLRDYLCNYCGHEFEKIVYSHDPDEYATAECRCGSKAKLLPSLIGGYQGDTGGGSTRPRHSTSMPKKSVFTGNPKIKDKE
jgi:DNA-directed RNA polymerase subunit RPC12/RpoP